MASIGLMGGTFDPIHYGHLVLAEQAWERFSLDKVLFVTAADPPHKTGRVVANAAHRYEMVDLAVRDNLHFELSRIEIDRPGMSYTVDTVKQILGLYGPDTNVYLLVGADEARQLMTWRHPREIQRLATIVVANRPCYPVSEALSELPEDFAARIAPLEMPGVDISSTDLRARVNAGHTIKYLVPQQVEKYIVYNGLYRGQQ